MTSKALNNVSAGPASRFDQLAAISERCGVSVLGSVVLGGVDVIFDSFITLGNMNYGDEKLMNLV